MAWHAPDSFFGVWALGVDHLPVCVRVRICVVCGMVLSVHWTHALNCRGYDGVGCIGRVDDAVIWHGVRSVVSFGMVFEVFCR